MDFLCYSVFCLFLHQDKSTWHRSHVLVYISPILTYLLGVCGMYFYPQVIRWIQTPYGCYVVFVGGGVGHFTKNNYYMITCPLLLENHIRFSWSCLFDAWKK